jgi:hypothetical protein
MIRPRVLLPVVLAGAGLVAATPAGASLAATATTTSTAVPSSATTLCTKAISDAKNGGWVHEVVTANDGSKHLTETGDIGGSEGSQKVSIGGATAQVLYVGHTAYITANKKGFSTYFELTKGKAGDWYSVSSSNSFFSTVTAAVTIRSDFTELDFSGPCTAGAIKTEHGQKVEPLAGHIISGTSQIPATLDVATGKKPLPVGLTATSDGTTEKATWSDWGKSVSLHKPSSSKSISSIGG